jgi:hypothetical protein
MPQPPSPGIDVTQVLVWTCVVVFIITCLLTLLGLAGILKLGGGTGTQHAYYMRWLFRIVIVEIVGVGVGVFAYYNGFNKDQAKGIQSLVDKANKDTSSTGDSTGLVGRISALFHRHKTNNPPADSVKALLVKKDTLSVSIYVTTDGPKADAKTITIPPNARYLSNTVTLTTGNGDYHLHADETKGPNNVVNAVTLKADVADKSLFGPRNWCGAVLYVYIERQL